MDLITIDTRAEAEQRDYRPDLEAGNVLYFPAIPFSLPETAKELLRNLDFSGTAVHKNIAYRPASDRITGVDASAEEQLRAVFKDYSRNVVRFAADLLPEYAKKWKLDYASFRPLEEQGRDLPTNKRNDLMHTDAFPSRPVHGNLILRIFTNIHLTKPRVWVTSDPFPKVAERYAKDAGLESFASDAASPLGWLRGQSVRAMSSLGLPVTNRSAYDRFMLRFHEYLKRNQEYQRDWANYRFEFPPGSTWLVFTDVVPHSVQSGQHALEQTVIVARESMADPGNAPVSILERLCGKPLLGEASL
jgi:hypothetical protein